MEKGLVVRGLRVAVESVEILKGIDLTVESGRAHALMGPNGSGKSTLSFALTGHPKYTVTAGTATLDGVDLLALPPHERARAGLFLSFQYPASIPGVSVANFLRGARSALRPGEALPPAKFKRLVTDKMELLGMEPSMLTRYVNDGFSGGEKKRLEMLQMAVFEPKYAILDETDSGLDVDALKAVGESVNALRADRAETGLLVITHYPRILQYLRPDRVHVMMDGRIVKEGGADLADRIEREGYDPIREEVAGGVA
ncbi:MAG TPA: Fe-S cluster assembly ATPase SufC [Candidatus Dormibacteraeota bacterium]|nr:Fe-S cluster assembly ATPase SufC [Candidatus Dormibacteraeota bacterium]